MTQTCVEQTKAQERVLSREATEITTAHLSNLKSSQFAAIFCLEEPQDRVSCCSSWLLLW